MSKQPMMDESQLVMNRHSYAAAQPSNRGITEITEASSSHRNEAVPVNEVEGDYGVLNYINQIIMEDDSNMYHDRLALEAAEEYSMYHDRLALEAEAAEENSYQVLHEVNFPVPRESPSTISSSQYDFSTIGEIQPRGGGGIDVMISSNTGESRSNGSGGVGTSRVREVEDIQQTDGGRDLLCPDNDQNFYVESPSSISSSQYDFSTVGEIQPRGGGGGIDVMISSNTGENRSNGSGGVGTSRVRLEEDIQQTDGGRALLCHQNLYGKSPWSVFIKKSSAQPNTNTAKRLRPNASDERRNIKGELVDLEDLLLKCSRLVALYDLRTAKVVLISIRRHSSYLGDSTQRSAHYLANALEARIVGEGTNLYASLTARRGSCADILEACCTYVKFCPFHKMSNIIVNKSIQTITRSARKIHIIDFGILDSIQWSCLIQDLSLKPGGAPSLRITGIHSPQWGFQHTSENTGHILEEQAKRLNIPFEYDSITKEWDTLSLDDIRIDKDEFLVVNCLYMLKNINDEVVIGGESSPRDLVMKFIKKLNPDLFVHGIMNAKYNGPFFETRFKEAMYHFSCFFDMFETILPREDEDRLIFESEILGRDVMNVIACEGSARIDRPDSYKQWQLRNERAGFKQLPLDKKIIKEVKINVKSNYNKGFYAGEESNWLVQGFKGRVIYAISCWTPINKLI